MTRSSGFRLGILAGVALVASCGGGDGPDDPTGPTGPVPASINVLPQNRTLTAIGDTIRYVAQVRDQNGAGIVATVSWTSSDPSVVTVGSVGEATAVSNGSAQITATAGTASATVSVTVDQEVATVEFAQGEDQSGITGLPLPEPVSITVLDSQGFPIAGETVEVTVTGGSVDPASGVTDGDGEFEVVWTAPAQSGNATLTATAGIRTGRTNATFFGRSDLLVSGLTLSPSSPTPDQTFDVAVQLANTGEGLNLDDVDVVLSIDGEPAATRSSGAVPPGSTSVLIFRDLAALAAGAHTVSVELDPDDVLPEDDEDNNTLESTFAVVEAIALSAGEAQAGLSGTAGSTQAYTVQVAPGFAKTATSLDVTLTGGTGNPDLYVRFDEPPTTTDFDCASFTAGAEETCSLAMPESGTYHVLVDAAGDYADTELTASVAEDDATPGPFDIEVVFQTPVTDSQREAFESAEELWEQVILEELIDVDFGVNPLPAQACGPLQREVGDVVDDLRILVDLVPLDGEGGTLGGAGPCTIREDDGLPILGIMVFDLDDLDWLEEQGDFEAVVFHEMAHVLGFGPLWEVDVLLIDPSSDEEELDTHFVGERALAAFETVGGDEYVGAKVPVENTGGPGTANGHWRENVFGVEVMTGFQNSGELLSIVTIESMADIGYVVDPELADEYVLPSSSGPATAGGNRRPVDLSNDVRRGPIYRIDRQGRILGIIQR